MRTLALVLLFSLPAALCATAQPPAAADKKADYDALRKQVRVAMDAGRYKDAKELLVTKLADHKDAEYVKAERDAIRADIKTCSFRIAFPKKPLRELIDGELTITDAKTGQVSLVYDRKDREAKKPALKFPGGDFEADAADLVSRYSFDGPYSVQFTGTRLGLSPIVHVGIEVKDEVTEAFRFEINRQGLTCLDRIVGEEVTNITNCTNDFDISKPYVMRVFVRDAQIEVLLNGKRVVAGKKPTAHFGRIAYRSFTELERIEVVGKLSKKWIDEQVEARSATDLAEFVKTYDAKADLPEWLR